MTIDELLVRSGLLLDVAGVAVLYRYTLPSRYPKGDFLALSGGDKPDEREQTRFRRWSKTGLALLMTGFALQFLGTLW